LSELGKGGKMLNEKNSLTNVKWQKKKKICQVSPDDQNEGLWYYCVSTGF
jgi:hypothetical protein